MKKAGKKIAKTKNHLERVKITGIHGSSVVIDAVIENGTLILVGENGSGKTTFLRILFNLLSGRMLALLQTRFKVAELTINGEKILIKYKEIERCVTTSDQGSFPRLPPHIRRNVDRHIRLGGNITDPSFINKLCENYGIPRSFIISQLELFDSAVTETKSELAEKFKKIRLLLDSQILYLPTYRRIERELTSILDGFDPDQLQHTRSTKHEEKAPSYLELVEFGMRDVKTAVEGALANLREFQRANLNNLTLKYLGDIISGEYKNADTDDFRHATEEDIESVLLRMDENILPAEKREDWFHAIKSAKQNRSAAEHDQIIRHYFGKLLKFQLSLQEKEANVEKFCKLCNVYIKDKRFVYDSATFTFAIRPNEGGGLDDEIQLSDLSSGEKQVVSLFSHLYLSGHQRYFVLIDEPELSLSVPWQRRFLMDIREGDFCSGLVAVTHSPFIYDNELKPYAHALGEFTGI